MRVETEYQKKLKIKKSQQRWFRLFLRGSATPINLREWIGLNHGEVKELLEERMHSGMNWQNYGTFWIVDHVVPFWIFDLKKEADLKLLWHPENLLPLVWADNNHKQGDLRFAVLLFSRRMGQSVVREMLIERCEKEIKVQDKYLKHAI